MWSIWSLLVVAVAVMAMVVVQALAVCLLDSLA
jgi:hypothetical protein